MDPNSVCTNLRAGLILSVGENFTEVRCSAPPIQPACFNNSSTVTVCMYVYMYTKLHRHIIILNIDRERQCSAQHNIIVADCECDEGN